MARRARPHRVQPGLPFPWRQRMARSGQETVGADPQVVPTGRETMDTRIQREARAQGNTPSAPAPPSPTSR